MAYYDLKTGKRVAPPENGCLPVVLLGVVLLIAMVASIIEALTVEMLILSGLIILAVVAFIVFVFKKAFAGNHQETNAPETKATAAPSSRNMDAYKLADVLKGQAPASVLEHCDSIMHNAVLLETYIMQCVNNDEISSSTASLLRERYAGARARVNSAVAVNRSSAKTQAAPSRSYDMHDLERYFLIVYNSAPNKQCVDQLCKLYGTERFLAEICNNVQFCQAVYAANQSKELLGFIYRHNQKAAYMICLNMFASKSQQ